MSKVIAYTALHYGAEYLPWAIRSVIDAVDEYWVLYSDVGSHGHHTAATCPDNRAQLFDLAREAAGDKLRWVDGRWAHEGYQRDSIFSYVPDADAVLVLDADEIWQAGSAAAVIEQASTWHRRNIRVPMIHYWRSWYRCMTDDPAFPVRVIFPAVREGEATASAIAPIHHFGYAQSTPVVEYKQHTHGHKAEWRIDWFDRKWVPNSQFDVHPTNINYWTPAPVDPFALGLPAFMRSHPYATLEVIP